MVIQLEIRKHGQRFRYGLGYGYGTQHLRKNEDTDIVKTPKK